MSSPTSFQNLLFQHLQILVLDEADRYVDMGDEIDRILEMLPRKRQTLLFSATLPSNVKKLIGKVMTQTNTTGFRNNYDYNYDQYRYQCNHNNNYYENIDCIIHKTTSTQYGGGNHHSDGSPNTTTTTTTIDDTSTTVKQSYMVIPNHTMFQSTLQVLSHYIQLPNSKVIVFFPTTDTVALYAHIFNSHDRHHSAAATTRKPVLEIHSQKSQGLRIAVSNRFREISTGALFTSDISARGVDLPGITHVIQVGMPETRDAYVHRVGRTGRANQSGEAILLMAEIESGFLKMLKDIGIGRIPVVAVTDTNKNNSNENNTQQIQPNTLAEAFRQTTTTASTKKKGGANNDDNSDKEFTKLVKNAYRSMLGFYSGKLRQIGVRSSDDGLVGFLNSFAVQAGLTTIPEVRYRTAVNLRLEKAVGLNIVADNFDDDDDVEKEGIGNETGGFENKNRKKKKHKSNNTIRRDGKDLTNGWRQTSRRQKQDNLTETLFDDGKYDTWGLVENNDDDYSNNNK